MRVARNLVDVQAGCQARIRVGTCRGPGEGWGEGWEVPAPSCSRCISVTPLGSVKLTEEPLPRHSCSKDELPGTLSVPSPIPSASRYKRARVNERRAVAKGSMGDVARLRADERGKGSPAARARVGCRRDWWEADLQVPPAHFEVGQARTRAAA